MSWFGGWFGGGGSGGGILVVPATPVSDPQTAEADASLVEMHAQTAEASLPAQEGEA